MLPPQQEAGTTLSLPPIGGPARHGDTLDPRMDDPNLREILGDETSEKVRIACRYMGLQMQVRQDISSRNFYYNLAKLFAGR